MHTKTKKKYILYGTLGCHLCDYAQQVLSQAQYVLPIVWQEVDIALDQNLMTKYASSIPVLSAGDGQELRWPFSVLDVQRLQNQQ
ncbi:MAG: glutaredoxin family protein [Pseudomonadales bacterium]|nr:glutaredoxin family protein [Pseudomonadales bacterium]